MFKKVIENLYFARFYKSFTKLMSNTTKSAYVSYSANILFYTFQSLKNPSRFFVGLLLFSDPLLCNTFLEFFLNILWKLYRYIETFYINNNWNKPAFLYFTSIPLTIKFRWIVINKLFVIEIHQLEIKTSIQLSKLLRIYSSSFIPNNIFCIFKNKTCSCRNLFYKILSDQKGKVH